PPAEAALAPLAPHGRRNKGKGRGGDLRGDAARLEQGLVDTGHQRRMPAGLAVGQVTREATAIADAEAADRTQAAALDRGLDLFTALSAGQLLVLLAELATRAEQAALDHLA